jgi:hypothetical protein
VVAEPVKISPSKVGKEAAKATESGAKVENFGETGINLVINSKKETTMLERQASIHKS